VGNICLVSIGLSAKVPNFLHYPMGLLFTASVVDHHIGSGLTKGKSNCFSDAGVGTCYQGLLPSQDLLFGAGRHDHVRELFSLGGSIHGNISSISRSGM
jgi:hypothetical protein